MRLVALLCFRFLTKIETILSFMIMINSMVMMVIVGTLPSLIRKEACWTWTKLS